MPLLSQLEQPLLETALEPVSAPAPAPAQESQLNPLRQEWGGLYLKLFGRNPKPYKANVGPVTDKALENDMTVVTAKIERLYWRLLQLQCDEITLPKERNNLYEKAKLYFKEAHDVILRCKDSANETILAAKNKSIELLAKIKDFQRESMYYLFWSKPIELLWQGQQKEDLETIYAMILILQQQFPAKPKVLSSFDI